ncbi:VPLPA-CTERM sorting domain-containing protein [Pseudooceanicola sp. LIPI14-2-Ac024]|uniref:VPLPA-CTERM sorting domain-containing protein n=1 Tax=Pseudooceanicola sp. LIPI14-2-Ac024 TaxID=3344875 RepID=UPI0035D0D8FB
MFTYGLPSGLRRAVAASAVALAGLAGAASASSIITDGNVSLGVDDYGQLNVPGGVADIVGQRTVGVRWIAPSGDQYESTSHGCLCEGWGVLADGVAGSANNNFGAPTGLTLVNFASTATTATSVVNLTGTDLNITHSFELASGTDDLYRVNVTVENTGATDIGAVTYRRAMDWDTSPTPFSEYVTIAGTGTTTLLEEFSDDGFVNTNMVSVPGLNDIGGCGTAADFFACGPSDHGAAFDFALGGIDAGESYSFDIFYGGAANKSSALAALGAVGAELYSFGWSGTDANQDGFNDTTGVRTPTFIFAFAGVGGTIIVPPPSPTNPIPVPAAGWLMVAGFGALAAMRRRRAKS